MAKAKEIQGVSCEQPYGEAAAIVLDVRSKELEAHARGVLDTEDIERLHDMRVATRRLRASLEVFEPCFPSKAFRATLKEVKALADVLGERRDRDVAIASLRTFAQTIAAPDRPGVESLITKLKSEQVAANEAIAEFVGGPRLSALIGRLRALVEQAQAAADASVQFRDAAQAGDPRVGDDRTRISEARDLQERWRPGVPQQLDVAGATGGAGEVGEVDMRSSADAENAGSARAALDRARTNIATGSQDPGGSDSQDGPAQER
ncbi:MAG: CHAD domain-containing protein [Solirubrobacterales bacterium]